MGQIREELTLVDNFSSTFNKFESAASSSVNNASALGSELDSITANFAELNRAVLDATAAFEKVPGSMGDAEGEQRKVTDETKRTADAANNWLSTLKNVALGIGGMKFAKEFIETSDEMSQITAKLNQINDGAQTTAQLEEMIFQSAQRSRGSYADTAQLVAKLAMNAREVFTSNRETVAFAENLNKAFQVAGASAQEQASVILQMSQALSGGILRGQEFNAVMSGAPNVIRMIAEYMGVSVGEMRNLAAEGQITSDIVKNALLASTDKLNDTFATLPKTWGSMIQQGKNVIQRGLADAFNNFSQFINTEEWQEIMDTLAQAVTELAKIAAEGFMAIGRMIVWVKENWESLEPVVMAAVGAFLLFKAVSVASALATAASWAVAHWWILAIVGAIAVVLKACHDIGVSFKQVGEVVGGVLGRVYAFFQNIIARAWNLIAAFAEFFANVWEYPIDSIIDLFVNLAVEVTGIIRDMADWLAALFGMLGAKNVVTMMDNALGAGWEKTMGDDLKKRVLSDEYLNNKTTFDRMTPADIDATGRAWANRGAELGGKIDDLIDNFGSVGEGMNAEDWSNIEDNLDKIAAPNGGIAEVGKVGEIGGDVNLADEDLKVFRDLAEMKYMQAIELQTLAPNINVTVPASEGGTLSAEDVADAIKVVLVEQMAAHTSTAHG